MTLTASSADKRTKIKSFVEQELVIEDTFAGQSFTLKKEDNEFIMVRKIFGSGRPIVAEIIYDVKFESDYQLTFSKSDDNSKLIEEFLLIVNEENALNLYLNGLKLKMK